MDRATDPLEELLKEALEDSRQRQWRRDNPYVADLIELLFQYGDKRLARAKVIDQLETTRRSKGLPVPDTFEQTIQSAFNQHCTTSSVFRKRNVPEDGVFVSKRDGSQAIWGVRTSLALAWLARRNKGH